MCQLCLGGVIGIPKEKEMIRHMSKGRTTKTRKEREVEYNNDENRIGKGHNRVSNSGKGGHKNSAGKGARNVGTIQSIVQITMEEGAQNTDREA